MRKSIAPINDRISKCLVVIVDANLGPQTPSQTFFSTGSHVGKVFEVALNAVVSVLGRDTISSLLAHLVLLLKYKAPRTFRLQT
jgi:hypothetical protein